MSWRQNRVPRVSVQLQHAAVGARGRQRLACRSENRHTGRAAAGARWAAHLGSPKWRGSLAEWGARSCTRAWRINNVREACVPSAFARALGRAHQDSAVVCRCPCPTSCCCRAPVARPAADAGPQGVRCRSTLQRHAEAGCPAPRCAPAEVLKDRARQPDRPGDNYYKRAQRTSPTRAGLQYCSRRWPCSN